VSFPLEIARLNAAQQWTCLGEVAQPLPPNNFTAVCYLEGGSMHSGVSFFTLCNGAADLVGLHQAVIRPAS
jgi:hypothetical protein